MLRFFAIKSAKPSTHRWTFLKSISALGLAFVISFSTIVPANAFFFLLDPNLEDDIEHFIECKHWLFTDPQMHSDNCLPSNYLNPPGAISTLAGGDNPPYPPAPPPPPPPPPETEPEDPETEDPEIEKPKEYECMDSCECDKSCEG